MLASYGVSAEAAAPVVRALKERPEAWIDFMMRFELDLEKPDPKRALVSAATIAGAYIGGPAPWRCRLRARCWRCFCSASHHIGATMLTFGMLKNLCALVFLALAVSPFTAPFQTCADATAPVVAPLNNDNDPGSLVSPLVTKAGRLTVAAAPPAALGVSYVVPLALFTPFILLTSHIQHESIRPTILRV